MEPREESRGWIVAPTYGLTRAIFERLRLTVLQHLRHRVVEDAEGEYRLVVRNLAGGLSEVQAKSADNSVSLLGEGLDWLILDEAARVRRMIWESHLSQRLLDRRGWALLLSTPRGTGWFWGAFRRGQKGRDPQYESWRSPSWENPHLDRELIEAERPRLSPDAYEQEYEARFLGEESEPCDECGCPTYTIPPVLVLYGEEEPKCCADCGNIVGPDGRTVVMRGANGLQPVKIRRMGEDDEDEPYRGRAAQLQAQSPELN